MENVLIMVGSLVAGYAAATLWQGFTNKQDGQSSPNQAQMTPEEVTAYNDAAQGRYNKLTAGHDRPVITNEAQKDLWNKLFQQNLERFDRELVVLRSLQAIDTDTLEYKTLMTVEEIKVNDSARKADEQYKACIAALPYTI